jgi:glycine/D-amino acid oxidase-like deaminating enzyme
MTPPTLELFPPLEGAGVGSPPWLPVPPLPPRALPGSCDVVIVGAGITGLAAASACARSGFDVVVIDRAFGTGATARSGGVVLGDTLEGPDPDFDGCESTLRQWIEGTGADCDLRWCGCLELARDDRLSPSPVDWHDAGPVRVVGQVAGGVLDPARLQLALLADAQATGAAVVDRVTVTDVRAIDGALAVTTPQGAIRARAGIMAVDALCWRPHFDPWSERVMTIASQTAPLEPFRLQAIGLKPDQAFYTVDKPLLWGRVMPDGSLLVGRETEPFPPNPESKLLHQSLMHAGGRLSCRVRGLHPILSEVRIDRIWMGPLARTKMGHPTLDVDPDVPQLFWCGGYGGQGIAQAFALGRRAGRRLEELLR